MKIRLDTHLLNTVDSVESIEKAQALILTGKVIVNNEKITKPGTQVKPDTKLTVLESRKTYVSRAGEKLEKAHHALGFDIKGRVALDIGQSTGGFTDYLLQKGARAVFGVDVAYGIVDIKIREHPDVVVIEKCNARHLNREEFELQVSRLRKDMLPLIAEIDLVVVDVSFINVEKVLAAVTTILTKSADIIVLIKPQFEAKKNEVEDGGVIQNPELRKRIIDRTVTAVTGLGMTTVAVTDDVIKGKKGNHECVAWFKT